MRIIGWLAMALSVVGIVLGIGMAAGIWVIRGELQTRVHELVASADAGLARSAALTDVVSGNIAAVSTRVGDVKARADQLVITPADGPIATGLATAINDFITGPYTVLRTEILRAAGACHDRRRAASGVGSRDPRGHATRYGDRTAAGDGCPAAGDRRCSDGRRGGDSRWRRRTWHRIQESLQRATEVQQVVTGADEIVSDVAAKIQDLRVRLAATDDKVSTALSVGAGVGLIFGLYFAGLNVLLFRQGRRWSRQESTSPA